MTDHLIYKHKTIFLSTILDYIMLICQDIYQDCVYSLGVPVQILQKSYTFLVPFLTGFCTVQSIGENSIYSKYRMLTRFFFLKIKQAE